jgi:hypothetical protein
MPVNGRHAVLEDWESRGVTPEISSLGRHRSVDRQAHYVKGSLYRNVPADYDHNLSQLTCQVCALSHRCPTRRVALHAIPQGIREVYGLTRREAVRSGVTFISGARTTRSPGPNLPTNSINASPGGQAPAARRQARHGPARASCLEPARSRPLVVAARTSYEKCADQPVASKNRRLTRTTEAPILRFAR